MKANPEESTNPPDRASGAAQGESSGGYVTCTAGLAFALLLTGAGLLVLAIAQMGVHLVFFLQIGTGPDNTNNVIALAFGVLIVTLIISGSLWIMANLNSNMLPAAALMEMQR